MSELPSSGPTRVQRWKAHAIGLKSDTYALYLACRDPRVPWYAKLLAALVVAYALSPIDLIPDFIPILGYLDDLLLVPAGVTLAVLLIPRSVMEEHRGEAARRLAQRRPRSWVGAVIVLTIWLAALVWLVSVVVRTFGE